MKNHTFYMLLCCTFIFLNNLCAQKNHVQYFTLINTAELEIVRGNPQKSLTYYKAAFNTSDKVFGKDLFNAALCAQELDSFTLVNHCLIKLVEKGCELNFLIEDECFSKFERSAEYLVFLSHYEKARMDFGRKCNWALRAKVECLIERDQFLRRNREGEGVNKANEWSQDSLVLKALIEYIQKDSFPSEHLTGIMPIHKWKGINPVATGVIFRHAYQREDNSLTPYMLNLVEDGVITPSFAINSLDVGGGKAGTFCREPVWVINDEVYLEKIEPNKKNQCNENRKAYHAESVEESIEKILYSLKYPESPYVFPYSVGISRINDLPVEVAKGVLKNFTKIN